MSTLLQDLRYGLRLLAKSPAFTTLAVLTLALGIGANTAIFSLIDAVMLRSIPVRDPQELVLLEWHARHEPKYQGYSSYNDCYEDGKNGTYGCSFSYPFTQQVQAQTSIFSGVAAFSQAGQLSLSGNGPAAIVRGQAVSGDFFRTLGVQPLLGRMLGPSDDKPSAPAVMVLQYRYWQRAFGGSPSVLGRTVRLNNIPVTIVGVASPAFPWLTPGNGYDLWIPLSQRDALKERFFGIDSTMGDAKNWFVVMVGRLKPGVSREQARAALSVLFRNHLIHDSEALAKDDDQPSIRLLPAQTGLIGERDTLRTPLYALMLAVAIILLIACANVAGLLLARSAARRKEIAVRLALGGSRLRIARQLLTESVLISLCGGALGVLFSYWGVRAITSMVARGPENPFPFSVSPDLRILAFTLAVSIVTGVLFGLAPALRGTRMELAATMKEAAGSTSTTESARARWFSAGNALTVVQFALAVVVLAGAGLLVRTLQNLRSINPGFDARNLLLFGINPELSGYKDAQARAFYRDLRERLAAVPGVKSVSYSSVAMVGGSSWSRDIHIQGQPEQSRLDIQLVPAGPDFLDTMRIPLLTGRRLTTADLEQAAAIHDAEKT
ncbi:MAG TPA: ABC transporter permease, partial [Terriglobales bacterium]|nr:ABC transporter permease [Terriglobales bacterium]